MKTMKKILCLTLALLMVLVSLLACKQSGGDEGTQSCPAVDLSEDLGTDAYGQEVYSDPTAGLNFNGKVVNFLVRSGEQYVREWFVDDPTTNLDQQIYARNITVQEAINVKINYIPQDEGANNEDFYSTVYNTAASGLGGIDVVSGYAAYATNPSVLPFYLNWFDSETLPYINLDRKYWNQNYQRDAAAFGKLYVNVGDMNLSLYDRCMVVFFNKAKAASYLKDSSSTPINLYELVQSGKWTYEVFYDMIKDIYEDTGTSQGIRDNTDFYGVTGIKGSEASDAFLYSLGGRLTEASTNDGSHSLISDESKIEKLGNIFESMVEFWYSPGAIMPSNSYDNYDIFSGGHALFTVDVVWHYSSGLAKLQSMSDGYGIIPMPKYDEDQENYITGVQDAYNVLSIMDCGGNQDFTMISATLEKMALESYSNVRPYYVENILMLRNMDYDSSTCFNYVLDGICWDFSDVYCAGIGWVRNQLWRSPFQAKASFDTTWANYNKMYNKYVQDFDATLISLK